MLTPSGVSSLCCAGENAPSPGAPAASHPQESHGARKRAEWGCAGHGLCHPRVSNPGRTPHARPDNATAEWRGGGRGRWVHRPGSQGHRRTPQVTLWPWPGGPSGSRSLLSWPLPWVLPGHCVLQGGRDRCLGGPGPGAAPTSRPGRIAAATQPSRGVDPGPGYAVKRGITRGSWCSRSNAERGLTVSFTTEKSPAGPQGSGRPHGEGRGPRSPPPESGRAAPRAQCLWLSFSG